MTRHQVVSHISPLTVSTALSMVAGHALMASMQYCKRTSLVVIIAFLQPACSIWVVPKCNGVKNVDVICCRSGVIEEDRAIFPDVLPDVERAQSSQPAGSVQGSGATEAGGSVATATPAEAETAGSNLHRAGPMAGAPTQSAALASGHSSAPQAAQAAAAIGSALEAALPDASGHVTEPYASSAALTAALPAPAGSQAQGEATDEGDTAAAAAHAQGSHALAAAAEVSAANAVSGVAPQVDHEQGTALHVAAEAAAQAAQAFVAQPAPLEGVGAGIDLAAAAVHPHAMQAEDEAADPAPPPLPPTPPPSVLPLQASAAQAHIGSKCRPSGSLSSIKACCNTNVSFGSRLHRSCRDICHSCRCPYGTSCSPRWRCKPHCSNCPGTLPCTSLSNSFSKQGLAPKGWPGIDSDSGAAKPGGFACSSWLLGSQCCWSGSVQESAQCLVSQASCMSPLVAASSPEVTDLLGSYM